MPQSNSLRFSGPHAFEVAIHAAGYEVLAKSKGSNADLAEPRPRGVHQFEIIARFEDFVSAKQYRPVYLAEICAAIGVSERTLRVCCQQQLGMAPIHYLWQRRMCLARRSLQNADRAVTTVTEIATEHGFCELGRFSVEYRALFGESPSATLRRSPP
jgi:AraC-like DNA-binding protein